MRRARAGRIVRDNRKSMDWPRRRWRLGTQFNHSKRPLYAEGVQNKKT